MHSHKTLLIGVIIVMITELGHAQYFEFSQYNFTQQRVNPAVLSTFNYMAISFDYRRQAIKGFNLNSNYINASMPLITKSGNRKSAVGVEFLDDRTGRKSLFQTQGLGVSYAYNFQLAPRHTLSVGTKVLFQSKKMNLGELNTRSQYIPDREFEEFLVHDENTSSVKVGYVSLNMGLYWQRTDKKGNTLTYAGISVFDLNKPSDLFLGVEHKVSSTVVGTFGIQSYKKNRVTLIPEVLATLNSYDAVFNIGWVTQYDLYYGNRIEFLTKYISERAVMTGVQLHRKNFSIGFSYDIPAGEKNLSNTAAFEVGLEVRKMLISKRKKRAKKMQLPVVKPDTTVVNKRAPTPEKDTLQQTPMEDTSEQISSRLKRKQDSIVALAQAGAIRHERFILEKTTLHFTFEFNSTELDEQTSQYLDELAQALRDNPQLKMKLTGHTDNIGSDKFNLRLSLYRAQAIKNLIVSRGVEPERIFTEGRGLREPLNDNKTEEDRNKNRRVELTILFED